MGEVVFKKYTEVVCFTFCDVSVMEFTTHRFSRRSVEKIGPTFSVCATVQKIIFGQRWDGGNCISPLLTHMITCQPLFYPKRCDFGALLSIGARCITFVCDVTIKRRFKVDVTKYYCSITHPHFTHDMNSFFCMCIASMRLLRMLSRVSGLPKYNAVLFRYDYYKSYVTCLGYIKWRE